MKLLYVPPLGGGVKDLREAGQHRRLLEDYGTAYAREFDEVLILSFFNETEADYPELKGNPRVRLLPNLRGWHRYLYAALAPRLHREKLKGVSVIRVSQATGALPAWFLKRALGRPVVMTYGYDYVLFAGLRGRVATWLARLHERIARATADFWITTTHELATLLQHRHQIDRDRIFLIPNGVSFKMFTGDVHAEDDDLRSLVFVGRLEEQKNLFFLLDCVSATAERLMTQLKLTIIGDGSLRSKLQAHPVSKFLKIELPGAVDQARLIDYFHDSQLFVTASRFEGHPKAVLEAMASGLPVLGLDAPGLTPLLKSAGQRVFRDVDSFVDNFRALASTETRAAAAARARAKARAEFDLEKNLLIETELLTRVARGKREDHVARI